jgi:hypothetical protein
MKLSRLFQPRNPLFWIMLALNVLSSVLAWIARNQPLDTAGVLLIGSFAILNAMLGTWLAWRLLRDEPAAVSNLKIE